MARWCPTCGREKELHPVVTTITADTVEGRKTIRVRECLTRTHAKRGRVPIYRADAKAYAKARKGYDKRKRKERHGAANG